MAFTTLMMFQLFNVYNCRSSWRSAFSGFFDNKWLLAAVALSLGTHVLVIYVPFLQTAFHTVPLTLSDWLVAAAGASTLLVASELVKIVLRIERRPVPRGAGEVPRRPERPHHGAATACAPGKLHEALSNPATSAPIRHRVASVEGSRHE